MSNHDMDIANGPNAAVRADINLALKALASSSSGATEPPVTFPGMPWFDESGTYPVLKIRNSANDGWIVISHDTRTWQNVMASRALATTFTNTTGETIIVAVSITTASANDYINIYINGALLIPGTQQPTITAYVTEFFEVPPGATYQATSAIGTGTLSFWKEFKKS